MNRTGRALWSAPWLCTPGQKAPHLLVWGLERETLALKEESIILLRQIVEDISHSTDETPVPRVRGLFAEAIPALFRAVRSPHLKCKAEGMQVLMHCIVLELEGSRGDLVLAHLADCGGAPVFLDMLRDGTPAFQQATFDVISVAMNWRAFCNEVLGLDWLAVLLAFAESTDGFYCGQTVTVIEKLMDYCRVDAIDKDRYLTLLLTILERCDDFMFFNMSMRLITPLCDDAGVRLRVRSSTAYHRISEFILHEVPLFQFAENARALLASLLD